MSWNLRALVVGIVTALLVAMPAVAFARFTSAGSAGLSVSTDTLAAPTNVTVTRNCSLFNTTVTVSWTATTDQYATGYVVAATQGGSTNTTAVSGRSVTSVTFDIGRYRSTTFTVTSGYRAWTSAPTTSTPPVQCNLLG